MKPITLFALSLVVSGSGCALWDRISSGQDRIEYSRIEADNRCDRYPSPHRGLCYMPEWASLDAPR